VFVFAFRVYVINLLLFNIIYCLAMDHVSEINLID